MSTNFGQGDRCLDRKSSQHSTKPCAFIHRALILIWQRPTFPGRYHPSIIGTEKLNCRVRYGYGCFLLVISTRNFMNFLGFLCLFADFSFKGTGTLTGFLEFMLLILIDLYTPSKLYNVSKVLPKCFYH